MGHVSLVSANLASVFFSSYLYGIFFILFCASMYFMARRHSELSAAGSIVNRSACKDPLFIGGVGFFITVTANWIIIVYRAFMAFVHHKNGTMPTEYYNIMNASEIVKTAIWLSALVISDAIIIYRLWVIWNRNIHVIIFPVSAFLGSVVCSVAVVYKLARFQLGRSIFDTDEVDAWVESDWVLTMCTNLFCCVFIAWRLWRIHSRALPFIERPQSRGLYWILAVFIESAALHVGWTILFMVTYETDANLGFFIEDTWPPVSGIAFMLINIRVGMGYAMHAQSSSQLPSQYPHKFTYPTLSAVDHDMEDEARLSDTMLLSKNTTGAASIASSTAV
ncbi:hypothetical protein BKA93DRAFT_608471 [Sparassis latifolia]